VTERVEAVRSLVGDIPVRCHFHNTRNAGLANAAAAVAAGASALDASLGGIGGCNFAPRATGNIPTEDLLYLLRGSEIAPAISMDRLISTVAWLEAQLGHPVPGMLAKAGDFPGTRHRT
jgi:hydroxymethylglutaryl-CoA lyase